MGILVPAALLPSAFITMLFFDDLDSPLANLLFFWLASLFCAAINFAIKKHRSATCEEVAWENKKTGKVKILPAKRHVNNKTGEEFITIIEDSFFFIPVRFWFAIYAVLGVCYYILK